jgi:hypothetical protein
MKYAIYGVLLSLALFAGMLVMLEVGRRVGIRRIARGTEADLSSGGALNASVFALLGLLLAFTFSGAASRFETRRQLIVEEANAIGTAYLRLDLLPASGQPALREKFKQYVDVRLAAYSNADVEAGKQQLAQAASIQHELWSQALMVSRAPDATPDGGRLLLPALNTLIDTTTKQTMANEMHPPMIVFAMLVGLILISSLLAGFSLAQGTRRNWIQVLCFAAVLSFTFYVILDLEFPRVGWIRLDDRPLVELRQTMK